MARKGTAGARSPDEAKRNPGPAQLETRPRISRSRHPGYALSRVRVASSAASAPFHRVGLDDIAGNAVVAATLANPIFPY